MTIIQGRFQNINGKDTTTIQSGDVIAFDPEHKRISFIRPSSDIQYGIVGGITTNSDSPGNIYFSSRIDVADFWNIIALLTATTGLIAEETKNFPAFKWAYRFEKETSIVTVATADE